MPQVTIKRLDLSPDQVAAALREQLGDRYKIARRDCVAMPDAESAAPRFVARRTTTIGMSLALLFSLLAVTAATATATRDAKATASVIGGHAATVTEYGSLAYIEGVQATAAYGCTGTVVAPRVILTAGHCVEDVESSSIVEPGEIAVATGVSDLRHVSRGQVSYVEKVLVYPGFGPARLHGDAGLLILSQPVDATPIELATGSDASLYEAGDELRIAGWGVDDEKTGQASYRLQAASVPVEEDSRCEEGTRRFYPFLDTGTQFCTLDSAAHEVTTCHGDSGGPAIATRPDGTEVEVGITSLGDGTCNPRSPAVYTRTDQISSWVLEWIDAVEHGGAEPQVRIPRAHIPTLTRERTEELSALAMEEAFGARFVHGHERGIHCVRQAKARLRCDVTWYQGANEYYGRLTVFYAIRRNVVLAGVHYTLHWVAEDCHLHDSKPQACRVHTMTR